MDDIQNRCHEHKGELNRLGDTGEERGKCTGDHDTGHFCFVFRFGAVINRQRGPRDTKHHDREETSLITACDTRNRRTGINGLLTGQEVRNIVDICHVEPEHGVQCMVQTDRN